ncbi:protein TANC2-like [Myxocyprinus asiaticus]|uniref:protein TANC2-like n=1 Tax=Myxocyprinus asiaticus TaxID=70543 RepID=UPI002223BA23|nr:protein TANC2-like [Myxocyprinus asiaticus]
MFRNSLKMLLTGGKTNKKSRNSSDGGNKDTLDQQTSSHDPLHTFTGQGGSIDSDYAFECDYAVPPTSMAEGLQHIRMMEGTSRSLPSSPLLAHQIISSRMPPMRMVSGMTTGTDVTLNVKL